MTFVNGLIIKAIGWLLQYDQHSNYFNKNLPDETSASYCNIYTDKVFAVFK